MKKQHLILGINLGILFLYSVLIRFSAEGAEAGFEIIIISAFLIMIHTVTNVVVAVLVPKALRKVFLLSALLVLLIGFSTCILNTSLA